VALSGPTQWHRIIPAKELVWIPLSLQRRQLGKFPPRIPCFTTFISVSVVGVGHQGLEAACSSEFIACRLCECIHSGVETPVGVKTLDVPFFSTCQQRGCPNQRSGYSHVCLDISMPVGGFSVWDRLDSLIRKPLQQ